MRRVLQVPALAVCWLLLALVGCQQAAPTGGNNPSAAGDNAATSVEGDTVTVAVGGVI